MTAFIGIDVSKHKLDCAWLRDPATRKVKTKVMKNNAQGGSALQDWLGHQTGRALSDCHIVVEATGVYHQGLAYALHDAGAIVSVMNPAQIHYYGQGLGVRGKTDAKDSVVLARYGATERPARWQPEPVAVPPAQSLGRASGRARHRYPARAQSPGKSRGDTRYGHHGLD